MQIPKGMRTPRELLKKRLRVSVRLDEELGDFVRNYAMGRRLNTTQVIEIALKYLMQVDKARTAGKGDET